MLSKTLFKPFLLAKPRIERLYSTKLNTPTTQRVTLETLLSQSSIFLSFGDQATHLTRDQLKKALPQYHIGHEKTKLVRKLKAHFDGFFKKRFSSEMANWVHDHLLYWNYSQWNAEKTLKVLARHFDEESRKLLESEHGFALNGEILRIIAEQLERDVDKQTICEDIRKLTLAPMEIITEIIEWADTHLLVNVNSSHIPPILKSLTIEDSEGLREYPAQLDCSFEFYEKEKAYLAGRVLEFLETKNRDNTLYWYNHSGPIIVDFNLPHNYTQYLQENVKEETNDICNMYCSKQGNYSETHKLIDIRVNIDPQINELLKDPVRYFLAKLIHSYINYVRPIKWPGVNQKMEDIEAIHIIMKDIEKHKITSSHVYHWMEHLELRYSEGRKIWFHFTIENADIMVDNLEEFQLAIPLVFCFRGGNQVASCVVKQTGKLDSVQNFRWKEECFAYYPVYFEDGRVWSN